jgi:hypothetical protein
MLIEIWSDRVRLEHLTGATLSIVTGKEIAYRFNEVAVMP